MSDDALIEAMAQAIDASLYGNKLNAVYCYQEAKAALAACRPIIEAPLRAENEKLREALLAERERCARIAERYLSNNEPVRLTVSSIAAAIRESGE